MKWHPGAFCNIHAGNFITFGKETHKFQLKDTYLQHFAYFVEYWKVYHMIKSDNIMAHWYTLWMETST